jgi:hypothetical protein
MDFNSLFKIPGNRIFRIAALIYGLVFCTVGALIFMKNSDIRPSFSIPASERASAACSWGSSVCSWPGGASNSPNKSRY